jgi:hypothetical protein
MLGIEDTLKRQIDEENSPDTSIEVLQEASYNREEVINAARSNLNMLAGLAMPTIFRYWFPPVLLAAWSLLVQSVDKLHDFTRIALGIPRGHGKTTLIKLFIVYCILFTNRKFILVISSTATLAENIVADVVDMLNESNLIRLFGDWKLGAEVQRQDLKKFGFRGRNIILAAIGAEGSLRGLNLKNERPDVMIFDDIQTKECAESIVQSDSLKRWMIGTAMKAKSPHGCLYIFCGNMYPEPASILKQLKSNPTWIKFISGAILADGSALWPELHPIQNLVAELDADIQMGHPEIFFSEVLNDTEAGINTKVDLSLLKEWKWGDHELAQGKFIIIDPASGKQGGDSVAIGYFEVYDATPGLREVIEERLSPGNTIRRALLMALRHGVKVIAVESTSYQATLLYWFDFIATQLGLTGFQFVEVYTGSVSKNGRISTMLKGLQAGETVLHPSIRSLVSMQISQWNPLKRDNVDGILDLLTYAPKVIELYGYMIATDSNVEMQESQVEDLAEDNHAF